MSTEINNIHCESIFDEKGGTCLANKWEFILTPYCEQTMRQDVFPHFELAVLQGERHELIDGRICYQFNLDNETTSALKGALFNVISQANARFN